jgi:2-methylisocitrate lyase-like PEP mutase family enzyme
LRRPGLLHAPEAYNVLAAKLAEHHGFEAIYIGGNMMSSNYLGVPDWGVITNPDMIEIAGHIAREVSIPAIVDADQGGETSLNVYRTVQQYEKAGFAALHLEDLLNPKLHPGEREKLFPNDPIGLASVDRMVLRIRAALEARSDPDFVIIARTLEEDIDKVIRRGNAYAKAGADLFMNNFSGMNAEQIDRVGREVPIPIAGIGVRLPNRGTQLKLNIYPNLVSGPAAGLCDAILREQKERGEVTSRPGLTADLEAELRNDAVFAQIAQKWVATP